MLLQDLHRAHLVDETAADRWRMHDLLRLHAAPNQLRPRTDDRPAANLEALFDPSGQLVSCYDLDGFDIGSRPGTFDACSIRSRLDYILISHSLKSAFSAGLSLERCNFSLMDR